jgi:hypothetical protein
MAPAPSTLPEFVPEQPTKNKPAMMEPSPISRRNVLLEFAMLPITPGTSESAQKYLEAGP